MSVWDIYLLTRVPEFGEFMNNFGMVCLILSLIAFGMVGMFLVTEGDESEYHWIKWPRNAVIISLIILFINVFIPTKSDLAIIFAGQWVTNSEEMQKLPNNVARTINKFMSEYLEGEKKDD